ncbi:hypothetical protein, partial, partial [Absidia glauca]
MFEGTVYDTFEEAAIARRLLEDDDEWENCLEEACALMPFASSIRKLFCYILLNCSPSNPRLLWDKFEDRLSDDYFYAYRRQHHHSNDHALTEAEKKNVQQRTLGDINAILESCFSGLSRFPTMPQDYINTFTDIEQIDTLIEMEHREYNVEIERMQWEQQLSLMNVGQREAYDRIVSAIEHPDQPRIFFVNGPGGTGKSLLFKVLLSFVRSQAKIAIPVASSGIAAILLPGGRTAHSRFKIPIKTSNEMCCNVRLNTALAKLLQETDLILWDEAVMSSKYNFEAVDRC